jgi:hypothetical protein
VFVTRLTRVDGEYLITVPPDVVVQHDLHDGQVISVVIEPLNEYVNVNDETPEPARTRWKLNERATPYDGSS